MERKIEMASMNEEFRRRAAQVMALPMFCLSLAFLIVVAILLVLWVDVPFFITPFEDEIAGETNTVVAAPVVVWITHQTAIDTGYHCLWFLLLIWPVFWAELVFQFMVRDRARPFWRRRIAVLLGCFCPPLRMCARNADMDGKIWFPSWGWREVDQPLREELEKRFSVPMIFIALTILPVLLVDFGLKEQVHRHPWLQFVLHASMGVIWFAFAAEFIVMVSVAEKRLKYCKAHWLDLAIILLPFISFLRSLRVVRATRLARLAKVQQLSKMSRLYRLRGLAMRAFRALLILQLLQRLLRISPERRLKSMRALLAEKEADIESLRREIAELERQVEQLAAKRSA